MSKAWALHKRVRSRTGLRAGVRPCGGDACAYIYKVSTKIAIIGFLKHENISIKRACAKFRCQSPAGPILAHKIPLPKSSPISPQLLILLLLLVIWDAFWTAKRV